MTDTVLDAAETPEAAADVVEVAASPVVVPSTPATVDPVTVLALVQADHAALAQRVRALEERAGAPAPGGARTENRWPTVLCVAADGEDDE